MKNKHKMLLLILLASLSCLHVYPSSSALMKQSSTKASLVKQSSTNLNNKPSQGSKINIEEMPQAAYVQESTNEPATTLLTNKPTQPAINFKTITKFDPTTPVVYDATYQNEFMSVPAKYYAKALQQKYPLASAKDVEEYTNLFLQENSGQYEQQATPGIFWNTNVNDINKPIKIRPQDITAAPKNPALQKLYTSMNQKQGVVDLQENAPIIDNGFDITPIETPYLDAITKGATNLADYASNALSTANDYAGKIISNIDQGATITNDYVEPYINTISDTASNVQQAIQNPHQFASQAANSAIRQGARYIKTALTTPADPDAPSFFEPETHEALGDLFNTGTQVAAENLGTFAKNSVNSSRPALSQIPLQRNPYAFTSKTQKTLNKAQADVTDSLANYLHDYVEQSFGKPTDPAILQEQTIKKESVGKSLAEKPLLPRQTKTTISNKPAVDADNLASTDTPTTNPVKTSSVVGYFTNTFQKTAQGLKRSPAAIKNFVKNVADTVSSMVSLSEKQTITLNSLIDQEINELTNNKESFVNADSKTFALKFNSWLKGFVSKCYIAVGKQSPTKLKVVSIQEHPTDPLAPTVALTFDGNLLQGATISYNNYSYKIPNENIKLNTDGSYSVIDLPLYDKKAPQSIFQQAHSAIYNSTVKNTVASPLKNSEIGKTLGDDLINTGEDLFLANSTPVTTTLSVDYKLDKSIVIKKTNTKTNIATTKTYNASGNLTEQIIDMPTIGTEDVFTPNIQLKYNPTTKKFDSINITHKNPITGKISTPISTNVTQDPATDIYRIEAAYAIPASAPQALKTQAIQYLKDNKLITDDTPADSVKKIEAMLDTIAPLLTEYPDQTFTSIVNNFDNIANSAGYIPANLVKIAKAVVPKETLDALNAFLLEPLPTSIQSVVIEYDPKTQQVAKNIVKRMSKGDPIQQSSIYESDGSLVPA